LRPSVTAFELMVTVLLNAPAFVVVVYSTVIGADFPGAFGSFGHFGTVHPQVALASEMIRGLSPVFLI